MRLPRRDTSDYPRIWTPGRLSALTVLLAFFFAWGAAQLALSAFGLISGAALSAESTLLWTEFRQHHTGGVWTFFTYALVHTNPAHFLINAVVLFLAGREVEPIIGRRQFLALNLVAWTLGGFTSWAAHISHAGAGAEVGGFAACVAAVLAAYSTIMPELEHRVNVFFVLPLRFRAKIFSLGLIALAAVCLATNTLTVVGPAGVIVGSLVGWIWAKQLGYGNPLWIQRVIFDRRQRESRRARMSPDDFLALEVDPILEKISQSGMQSLTRTERKMLELGRDKLASKPGTKNP